MPRPIRSPLLLCIGVVLCLVLLAFPASRPHADVGASTSGGFSDLPRIAQQEPPGFRSFYGSVAINGRPAAVGTTVEGRDASAVTKDDNPDVQDNPVTVTVAGQYGGPGLAELNLRVSLRTYMPMVIRTREFSCDAVTGIPVIECAALVTLYHSTNGPDWSDSRDWLTTNTPCNWMGVSCSGGHVTEMNLFDNQLSGSIPPELGNLANLWWLNLSSNRLSGSIPAELGNLANLGYLYLSSNQLSGSIPPALGNLAELRYLYLDSNRLSGSIPAELGNLAKLGYLDLSSNQLSGSIPPALGNLANLQYLSLQWNQLSGSIPPALGNLANLRYLYLYSNQLSGSIPAELGNLAKLEYLYLFFNQLSGSIPAELGNLANLGYLYLYYNQLSGSIPAELGNLANLQALRLSSNQLSGTVPDTLCNPPPSYILDLSYNKLAGAAECITSKDPDWAQTQTVAPTNLQAETLSSSSVRVSWTPILYTADGGYYEVGYATNAAGPFTVHGNTGSKSDASYDVAGLTAGTTVYFRVRTYTPAHDNQQNDLWSEYSQVVPTTP